MPNTVVELPETSKLPPSGAIIALRLLPLRAPPLTAEEAADPKGVLWNVTGRDGGTWTQQNGQYVVVRQPTQAIAFAVTGQLPEVAVQVVAGLCKQFGWDGRVQPLTAQDQAELQQQGLPLPKHWNQYIQQGWTEVPGDLYEFSATLWAVMDAASRREAFGLAHQINQSPAEAKAAFLAALPASMRIGPSASGEYRAACGARRTPAEPLLGAPCTTQGRCLSTRTGLCWHRWGIKREDVELVGEIAPGAIEVEVPLELSPPSTLPSAVIEAAPVEAAPVEAVPLELSAAMSEPLPTSGDGVEAAQVAAVPEDEVEVPAPTPIAAGRRKKS